MHHLPFAEASLGHKHRKKVGDAEQPDDSTPADDDSSIAEEESQSAAEQDLLYQQQPPALAKKVEVLPQNVLLYERD